MKISKALLIMTLIISPLFSAHAGKSNTDIYEKEEQKTVTFSGQVRVVRDVSEDIEVFFDSDKAKGAYYLARSSVAFLKDLEDAKKNKVPITVTVDHDNRILAVQKAALPDQDEIKKKYDKLFGG